MSNQQDATTTVDQVIGSLVENFDCQPVLFIGSGLSRRYIGSPDWEGVLRLILTVLPAGAPTFEYLAQKHSGNLISIGSELTDLIFEWAWSDGKSHFPSELFDQGNKDIFLKHILAELIKEVDPPGIINAKSVHSKEFDALRAIRPHAVITTNYDHMLEEIFSGYEAIVGKQVLRYNLNAYGEVYHIHRSVLHPETIVINQNDYSRWEKESKYFAAKLLTYFAEHPVIVLGYSLTDSNVRTVLQDIGGNYILDKAKADFHCANSVTGRYFPKLKL